MTASAQAASVVTEMRQRINQRQEDNNPLYRPNTNPTDLLMKTTESAAPKTTIVMCPGIEAQVEVLENARAHDYKTVQAMLKEMRDDHGIEILVALNVKRELVLAEAARVAKEIRSGTVSMSTKKKPAQKKTTKVLGDKEKPLAAPSTPHISLAVELLVSQQENSKLRAENFELQKQVSDYEEAYKRMQETLVKMHETTSAYQIRLSTADNEYNELRGKFEMLEDENVEYEATIDQMHETLSNQRQAQEDSEERLCRKIDGLENTVAELEAEVQSLTTEVEQLEHQVDEQGREINELQRMSVTESEEEENDNIYVIPEIPEEKEATLEIEDACLPAQPTPSTTACKPYQRELVYHSFNGSIKGTAANIQVPEHTVWVDYQERVNHATENGTYYLACSLGHANEITVYSGFHLGDPRPVAAAAEEMTRGQQMRGKNRNKRQH